MNRDAILEVKHLSKSFGANAVLKDIDFVVHPGDVTSIIGSSGSGKSTAMNIIGCLDVPTSGTYHLGGVDVSTMDDDQQAEIRNKMLGFICLLYTSPSPRD